MTDIKQKLSDSINQRLETIYSYERHKRKFRAVNWNIDNDGYTQVFWKQFNKQYWRDIDVSTEIDRDHWNLMTDDEKETFKKVLGGLTLLDTQQSIIGMPKLAEQFDDIQVQATLNFAGMMESIHAKSYSTIFTTFLDKFAIDEIFQWVENDKFLQYKMNVIAYYYENAHKSKADLYKALVASVYLESLLFYSGFFYPLYLAGHGRMMGTADMINLIIRDEAIHGVYVGMKAKDIYAELSELDKQRVDNEMDNVLEDLIDNEQKFTQEIYGNVELVGEVNEFVKYNANKALANIGKDVKYENVSINPIVETGLDTETKTHDFFSVKGNGYIKANIEALTDDVFDF